MEGALKGAEVNSMSAWEVRAWEKEFYWESKLTLGMWGSRAWEGNPWHGGGAGCFSACQTWTTKDESPKGTRMSQHQLKASLQRLL